MVKKTMFFIVGMLFTLMSVQAQTISNKVDNEGNGFTSVVSKYQPKDVPATIPFFDDFEDGDISDYNDLGGTIITEVSSATSANGTNSVHINGGTFGSGLSRTFESSQPNYISYYVMTPQLASQDLYNGAGYIEIGDTYSNEAIFCSINDIAGVSVYNRDSSEFVGTNTYELNTWYFIEFRDIDFNTQTFDFYVDSVLVFADVPFRNSIIEFGYFEIHNYRYTNNSEAYWDDIYNRRTCGFSTTGKSNKSLFKF